MATSVELLDRITSGIGDPSRVTCVSLTAIVWPLARAFWVRGVPVSQVPTPHHDCRVVGSNHVAQYHLAGNLGWANYEDIADAFQVRNSTRVTGGGKSTVLPAEIVDAPLKLLIRDRDQRIDCVVVTERIYPKRAWVGAVIPAWNAEMAYATAGILNSSVGLALYRRIAVREQINGHDLRQEALARLAIPLPGTRSQFFTRVAQLSYRLHLLHQANREGIRDLGREIANHRQQLLADIVRLYGWPKSEAWEVLGTLRADELTDVAGDQKQFFDEFQNPLAEITLVSKQELGEFEALNAKHEAGITGPSETMQLDQLRRLLLWQDRLRSARLPSVSVASKYGTRSGHTDNVAATAGNVPDPRLWRLFGSVQSSDRNAADNDRLDADVAASLDG